MWKKIWNVITTTISDFSKHDIMTKAAALALYCALGLAPVVLLVLAVTSWLGHGTEEAIFKQVDSMVGGQASEGIRDVMKSAKKEQQQQSSGSVAAIVGLVAVLFSASGIFSQLQSSLNDIWGVKAKPDAGFWSWIRSRLLSIGALLSVLFLLLVSLVLSAAVSMIFAGSGALWPLVNLAASVLIYVLLFALIFKILPEAEIRWRDVWIGALVTALFFAIGKELIGLYLGHSAVASSYGAAGSLVALIVWVYYSAIILFVGAEVTQAYARTFGSGVKPDEYAMRKDK